MRLWYRPVGMVHVVVLEGGQNAINTAIALIQEMDGWVEVRARTWIVATALDSKETRDYLAQAGNLQIGVFALSGEWATTGLGEVAGWMNGAKHAF